VAVPSNNLADSYVATAAGEAGSVVELADDRKSAKYTDLDSRYSFQPVATETLGSINDSARECLFNLGRKISLQSSDDREGRLFTALHGMQTRSSDENSVCPSVCLSVCLSVCQTRAL